VTGVIALQDLGLSNPDHGWYFRSLGSLSYWFPFEAARTSHLTWSMLLRLFPELLAVVIVALISLVTKVSSIELSRQTAGDLDREFRNHGVANLIMAPLGGLTSSLQVGSSSLLVHAGSATWTSGVVSALILGLVGVSNFDLPGLIPIPVVAGLVLFLGYNFLMEALWRPYSQRAWFDLMIAIAITLVCIRYGYLVGVLAGLICACLFFVISYARLGVVRRHLSRAEFPSYVDRPAEALEYLRKGSDSIQLYWLSGYIFFGSSEGVFERVRGDIEALLPRRVSYVVLDFGMVSGADSSAFVSLAKLRNYCDQHGSTLVYCSLSPANRAAFERGGFFGGKTWHQAFGDVNLALAWCEDQLLAEAKIVLNTELASFELWLQRQLGPSVTPADLIGYFERKETAGSQVLYNRGEPADTSISLPPAALRSIS